MMPAWALRLAALALAASGGLALDGAFGPAELDSSATTLTIYKITGLSVGLCNDGSDPAFYYRRARPGGEGKWVVMLQPGGQCWDQESCERRPFDMKSTRNDPDNISVGGMFNSAPGNALGDFNVVYVRYCSSDGWHGDRFNPFPGSWNAQDLRFFQGTHVIDAVFDILMNPTVWLPLDAMRPDDVVVFGGFSAGARGAMVNADRVRLKYGLTNMIAFLDSPYYVDVGNSVLVSQTQGVYDNFVRDSPMAAANRVSSWRDLFGEYRMPQVESRFLLVASQWDTFQLGQQIDPFDFVRHTRQKLAELRPKDPCSIVLAGAQYAHAASAFPLFYSQGFGGRRLDGLLNALVAGTSTCGGADTNTFIHPHGEACTGRGATPPDFDSRCMPATWYPLAGGDQNANAFEGQPNTACSSSLDGETAPEGSYTLSQTDSFEQCQAQCQAMPSCTGFEFAHRSGRCELWQVLVASRPPARNVACFRKTRFRFRGESGSMCVGNPGEPNHYDVYAGTELAFCEKLCANRLGCSAAEFVPSEQVCLLWRVRVATEKRAGDQVCAVKTATTWVGERDTACGGSGPSQEVATPLPWGACLERCLANLECHGIEHEANSQRCRLRLGKTTNFGPSRQGTSCARLLEVHGFRGSPGTECVAGPDSETYEEGVDYTVRDAPDVHACLELCRLQQRCQGVDFRPGQCRLFPLPIVSAQSSANPAAACLFREPDMAPQDCTYGPSPLGTDASS